MLRARDAGQAADFSWSFAGGGRGRRDAAGPDELSPGTAAGGFFVSREEYYGLFSAGYFGGGECGAFGFALFGAPVAAVTTAMALEWRWIFKLG
jgi:hypothetical protein